MLTVSTYEAKLKLFEILRTQAFFKERITLSSGKESDHYFDARRVTLSAAGSFLTAKIMLDMVKGDKIEAIGGPTLGADPMVGAIASLSYQLNAPIKTFIIRKAPKAHGKQQQLEGPILSDGASVVLIDDVATTGKAFLESLDVTDRMGIKVVKCISVINRQEGADEALAKRGCKLESIFTSEQFLKS
ncbi:MAG: orotate phosphoribosyltransferase [Candidatus Omnitrophica bacterium]|nr:orotate phosphoribosyltransferase [Candidatus Omnitrophota bacterium]